MFTPPSDVTVAVAAVSVVVTLAVSDIVAVAVSEITDSVAVAASDLVALAVLVIPSSVAVAAAVSTTEEAPPPLVDPPEVALPLRGAVFACEPFLTVHLHAGSKKSSGLLFGSWA